MGDANDGDPWYRRCPFNSHNRLRGGLRPKRSQPIEGLIVVKINGEGSGATRRIIMPTEKV